MPAMEQTKTWSVARFGVIAPPGQEGWREAPGWWAKRFGPTFPVTRVRHVERRTFILTELGPPPHPHLRRSPHLARRAMVMLFHTSLFVRRYTTIDCPGQAFRLPSKGFISAVKAVRTLGTHESV
jgi:hypothetical protein